MIKITEPAIEAPAIELFEKLGYQYLYASSIAPDSDSPERERFEDGSAGAPALCGRAHQSRYADDE